MTSFVHHIPLPSFPPWDRRNYNQDNPNYRRPNGIVRNLSIHDAMRLHWRLKNFRVNASYEVKYTTITYDSQGNETSRTPYGRSASFTALASETGGWLYKDRIGGWMYGFPYYTTNFSEEEHLPLPMDEVPPSAPPYRRAAYSYFLSNPTGGADDDGYSDFKYKSSQSLFDLGGGLSLRLARDRENIGKYALEIDVDLTLLGFHPTVRLWTGHSHGLSVTRPNVKEVDASVFNWPAKVYALSLGIVSKYTEIDSFNGTFSLTDDEYWPLAGG